MGQTAIPRNLVTVRQLEIPGKSNGGYPHDKTAQAASPAALPLCRVSCLAQKMNTEKVPQLLLSWFVSEEFAHSTIKDTPDFQSSSSSAVSRGVQLCGSTGARVSQKYRQKSNHSEHSIFTFRTEPFYIGTFILIKICTFKSHMLSSPTELEHWITTALSVRTVLRVYASKVARKFVTISFNFASVWSEIFPSVLWEEFS